jgi:hypothetical protein
MKMITHQAVNFPTTLPAGFSQKANEVFPIGIIAENILPPIASAHEVIARPSIFDP